MGRQIKKGIDYFSHDVSMKEDIKIKLLRAKFGLTGYAVYNLLLEDIYKNGYFLELNEDYILIFCDDNNLDAEQFYLMIDFMISRQLFSEIVYKNEKILTSKRIQSDFLHATTKRTEKTKIDKKYDVDLVISVKKPINSENTPINSVNGTHSIVEKSIVEESIEEKGKKLPPLKKLNVDEVIEGKTELPTKLVGNIQFDYIKNQWNEFAKDNQLHTIMTLTNKRISNIKARLKETEFDFPEILKKIAESSFLLGANNRNWKVDFDFIFSSTNNYLKILENKYKSNGSKISNENKRERLERNANAIESLIRNVTN